MPPLLVLGLLCLQAGAAMAVPGIVSPTDGSVLDGSTQTFTWSADGESVERWRIEVGTVPDGIDLALQSYSSATTSAQISGLPTDGSSVYVNLKWRSGGAVSVASYVYIAATDGPPPNPAPIVDAGDDQAIALPVDTVTLNASVTDDGQPVDTLVLNWSMSSGPGAVCSAAPRFASTPAATAAVSVEFRYQPDVLANPVNRFTLLGAPAGMAVHPDTGEVRWTPGAAGKFRVDLQAENSAGSQVQSFILDVP